MILVEVNAVSFKPISMACPNYMLAESHRISSFKINPFIVAGEVCNDQSTSADFGGILDRIDSLILVTPLVYYSLVLLNKIV